MNLLDSGGGGGSIGVTGGGRDYWEGREFNPYDDEDDDQERYSFGGIVDTTDDLRDTIDDWRSGDESTDGLRDTIDGWRSSDSASSSDSTIIGGGSTITTQGPGDGQAPEATAATGGSSDGLIVLAIKFGAPLAALAYLLYWR